MPYMLILLFIISRRKGIRTHSFSVLKTKFLTSKWFAGCVLMVAVVRFERTISDLWGRRDRPLLHTAMVATTRLELISPNLWDWHSTKLNYVANYGHWLSGSITQNLDNTTTISNGVITISSFIRCKPNWAICILIIIAVVPRRGLFRINAPIFWQFQLLFGYRGNY